jgi:putative transcriptional regulator
MIEKITAMEPRLASMAGWNAWSTGGWWRKDVKARTKKPSEAAGGACETVQDMRRTAVLGDRAKITLRHIGKEQTASLEPLSPDEIRALRDRARMSQAVFARHLNVTTGYVSQLERGAKHPSGAALALLNVIRRKGIEAIL